MARVSLIDERDHPEIAGLAARIRGARGGRLLNIYRMMLHSPPIAAAWLDFNSAVRFESAIDGQTRELAVIRIAMLNRVEYIVRAHGPTYALKEGLTAAHVEALADWRASPLFDDRQRALLDYVDAMTRDIEVPDSLFSRLRNHYSEREVVELTVLIGAYNMHTRVLKAFAIDPEPTLQQG
jgi:alkylhydroperoxidase family enzyme